MSGFQGANITEGGTGYTEAYLTSQVGSQLASMLLAECIVPGSPASYQLCKNIYAFHPLGAKLAEAPINMAQSQRREIEVPGGPETRLIPEFDRIWRTLGEVGADTLIHNLMRTSRIYGIAAIVVGDRKSKSTEPLDMAKLHSADLFFNVVDPLNTAGSLVLNQDPNSPDFQKARHIAVAGQVYHPSRASVVMNEQPIYIEFSASGFGFVGRSVYQRALYPLKTFLQSMITDQLVTQKVGLLIHKAVAPGSVQNNRVLGFFGFKRSQLKAGMTGNVLTIGEKEDISSLNFQNLEAPAKFARDNALHNVAMAASMPAGLVNQETMVSGFGEGTEDAKQIARYIDRVRIEMNQPYAFIDRIVQRLAWSPDFYKTIQRDMPEYRQVPYETAFYQWANSFTATWPNLLAEPDSERVKVEEVRFKSVVALVESLAPRLDPEGNADLIGWAADEINSRRELFSSPLVIDTERLAKWTPPQAPASESEEREPMPFSAET